MILADKIIRMRKKNGWSQEELAEKLSVSRQSVSKWEGAQSVPELDKILQMSKLFGVSTDYLVKDELDDEEYIQESADDDGGARRVTMQEANEFLAVKEQTAPRIALAVCLCILSPVCLLLLGGALDTGRFGLTETAAGGIGMVALFLLAASAVALFISCGMKTGRFEYLDKEQIDTEYGVTGMARERKKQYHERYVRANILGVCLCVLAVVPLFVCAMLTEDTFALTAALSGMLALAAAGVTLLILAGIRQASFDKLLQEGDYTKALKRTQRGREAISIIYWLAVSAGYIGYSLATDDWKTSWIVWPVAGVLFAAVLTAYNAFSKKE